MNVGLYNWFSSIYWADCILRLEVSWDSPIRSRPCIQWDLQVWSTWWLVWPKAKASVSYFPPLWETIGKCCFNHLRKGLWCFRGAPQWMRTRRIHPNFSSWSYHRWPRWDVGPTLVTLRRPDPGANVWCVGRVRVAFRDCPNRHFSWAWMYH